MPVISKTNPVNWGHPLNKGRVAWWKCLDGMGTGYQWRDLAGISHATLLNGAKPSSGMGMPGTFGSIFFDRTNDYATAADHPRFAITSQITLCATFLITTSAQFQHIIVKASGAAWGGAFAVWALRVTTSDTVQAWVNSAASGGNYVTGAVVLSQNTWYRSVLTYDGTTLRLYRNGVQEATTALSASISTSSFPVYIGGNTVGGDILGGRLDNVSVYNRALSANEVAQDYTLSRLGYPGVLNRVSNKVYFMPPSVTGNWHYYQQQYALMGAA